MFVEFEIICDSVDWKRAENGGIRTMGCTFRIAAAGNFCDLKRNLVKLKTLSTGVRIFNGAVRTEREFPLKILFLACAQGFVVLIITRNGAEISRSCYPKGASRRPYSAIFCSYPIRTAADNFNYNQENEDRTFSAAADCLSGFRFSNRKCIHFQTSAQSTIPVSADKVLSSFLPV